MKKTLYALVVMSLVFASCNKKPRPLSKEEMDRQIDSITQVQKIESEAKARRDLEYRMKIDVKVKADSILKAKLHPREKDTAHKSPLLPNKLM